MFWPPVEGGSLEVGNMKITMVKSTATNDIDTYQFTIEKPRSVSADTASFVHKLMGDTSCYFVTAVVA